MSTFGDFIRERRLSLGLSLESFCHKYGEDLMDWSRLERAVILPPKSEKRLIEIANELGLSDKDEFITLAKSAKLSKKKSLSPGFICGLKSEKKLRKIWDLIKDETTPRKERMK